MDRFRCIGSRMRAIDGERGNPAACLRGQRRGYPVTADTLPLFGLPSIKTHPANDCTRLTVGQSTVPCSYWQYVVELPPHTVPAGHCGVVPHS